MKYFIPTLAFLFLFIGNSFGQTEPDSSTFHKHKFAFVPQSLIYKGLRFEYERHIKDRNYLTVSPQFFWRENPETDSVIIQNSTYYKSLYGAGLDVLHTINVRESKWITSYFSYGAGYNYMAVNQMEYVWYDETLAGVAVLKYGLQDVKQSINSFAGKAIIGFKSYSVDTPLYLDVYCGAAIQKSFSSFENGQPATMFTKRMWEYGYSGTRLLVGLKVGLAL